MGNARLLAQVEGMPGVVVDLKATPDGYLIIDTSGSMSPLVETVNSGTGITVNNADPLNPIVNLSAASIASLNLAVTAVQPADILTDAVQDPEVVDDDNVNVYAPTTNAKRETTFRISTDGFAITAHIQPDDWEPGDIIRFVDYVRNFSTNPLTIDFESHNFQGATAQTLVINTQDAFPTLQYIDSTYGFGLMSN